MVVLNYPSLAVMETVPLGSERHVPRFTGAFWHEHPHPRQRRRRPFLCGAAGRLYVSPCGTEVVRAFLPAADAVNAKKKPELPATVDVRHRLEAWTAVLARHGQWLEALAMAAHAAASGRDDARLASFLVQLVKRYVAVAVCHHARLLLPGYRRERPQAHLSPCLANQQFSLAAQASIEYCVALGLVMVNTTLFNDVYDLFAVTSVDAAAAFLRATAYSVIDYPLLTALPRHVWAAMEDTAADDFVACALHADLSQQEKLFANTSELATVLLKRGCALGFFKARAALDPDDYASAFVEAWSYHAVTPATVELGRQLILFLQLVAAGQLGAYPRTATTTTTTTTTVVPPAPAAMRRLLETVFAAAPGSQGEAMMCTLIQIDPDAALSAATAGIRACCPRDDKALSLLLVQLFEAVPPHCVPAFFAHARDDILVPSAHGYPPHFIEAFLEWLANTLRCAPTAAEADGIFRDVTELARHMQTSSPGSVVVCLRRLDFWRAALLLVGKFDASCLAKGIDALLLLPTPALSMAQEVFQFIEANVPLLDDDDDDDALQHFKTALAARLLALARVDVARTTALVARHLSASHADFELLSKYTADDAALHFQLVRAAVDGAAGVLDADTFLYVWHLQMKYDPGAAFGFLVTCENKDVQLPLVDLRASMGCSSDAALDAEVAALDAMALLLERCGDLDGSCSAAMRYLAAAVDYDDDDAAVVRALDCLHYICSTGAAGETLWLHFLPKAWTVLSTSRLDELSTTRPLPTWHPSVAAATALFRLEVAMAASVSPQALLGYFMFRPSDDEVEVEVDGGAAVRSLRVRHTVHRVLRMATVSVDCAVLGATAAAREKVHAFNSLVQAQRRGQRRAPTLVHAASTVDGTCGASSKSSGSSSSSSSSVAAQAKRSHHEATLRDTARFAVRFSTPCCLPKHV